MKMKMKMTLSEAPRPFIRKTLRSVAQLHRQILDRLGPSPTAEDQLGRDLNVAAGTLGSALVELELQGDVERDSGGLVTKIPRN